jgi:hypothetical protein
MDKFLISLYNTRNKVIHRYVISDLRSNDIAQLVYLYSQINYKLADYLSSLEKRQYKEQIDIYKGDMNP